MARTAFLSRRVPVLTLSVVGAALLAYVFPSLGALLVYDRQAVLDGAWWRLASAPLVHFSLSHLTWNLLVFAAAGWVIETARLRSFWLVCVLAAVGPGPVYLAIAPRLAVYGGLSGLATAAVAYLGLVACSRKGRNRSLWGAVLVLVGAKVFIEAVRGEAMFVQAGGVPFRVLPLVHGIGLAAAAAVWLSRYRYGARS